TSTYEWPGTGGPGGAGFGREGGRVAREPFTVDWAPTNMSIGKLEKVDLRELWRHVERGFSAWLVDNLDALTEVLGFPLEEPRRDVPAGSFEVDVVAEDENSNLVVIENQLEATDHDHLGKVLTYLTNLDAKRAVWITRSPRPEHVKAVVWLNET